MRYLAPDAAASLLRIESITGGLAYTDVFRTARGSLDAFKSKPGTKRPGYSPHGYGIAVDVDLGKTLRMRGITYAELVDLMGHDGWYCHRRDLDSTKSESWHFNYLGDHAKERLALVDPQNHATWDKPAEAEIQARYGAQMSLRPEEIRSALAKLNYNVNPTMGAAIEKFQADWALVADGVAGPVTQRTLAYCAAVPQIVAPPSPAVV